MKLLISAIILAVILHLFSNLMLESVYQEKIDTVKFPSEYDSTIKPFLGTTVYYQEYIKVVWVGDSARIDTVRTERGLFSPIHFKTDGNIYIPGIDSFKIRTITHLPDTISRIRTTTGAWILRTPDWVDVNYPVNPNGWKNTKLAYSFTIIRQQETISN